MSGSRENKPQPSGSAAASPAVPRSFLFSIADQARFLSLFDSSPDSCLLLDPDGIVLAANSAARTFFAPTDGDIVGRRVLDLVELSPEDLARAKAAMVRTVRGEHLPASPYVLRSRNGAESAVEVRSQPIEAGDRRLVLLVVRDVSEHRLAQEAALEFGRLIDESLNEIYIFDAESLRFLRVNRGGRENLGYTTEELQALTPFDLKPEFDAERFEATLRPLRTNECQRLDFRAVHRRKDGSQYPVDVHLHRTVFQSRPAFVAMVVDVTERERAAAEQGRRDTLYRQAQRIARLGHWEWDAATDRMDVSEELLNIYDLGGGAFDGKFTTALQRIHPDDCQRIADLARGARESRTTYGFEYRIVRSNGEIRTLRDQGVVERDASGNATRMFGTVVDITEREKIEREVRMLNARLEQRVRERTAELQIVVNELESFSYAVSHDLRQPLRTLDGSLRLLVEDAAGHLDDRCRDHVDRALATIRRMASVIDDLLKLARVARAELVLVPFDLGTAAAEVAAELARIDPSRRVAFRIATGLEVVADRGLVRVLLENLLGNAWKFSSRIDDATIELGAEIGADGSIVYVVRDNGAGFDAAHADKIFVPFQRLHAAEEFEGTGIGLATAARIVSRHGGRIWAQSDPGTGTVLRFTLGAPIPARSAAAAAFQE